MGGACHQAPPLDPHKKETFLGALQRSRARIWTLVRCLGSQDVCLDLQNH